MSSIPPIAQKNELSKFLADALTADDDRRNAMLQLLRGWVTNKRVLDTLLDLVSVDNSRKQNAQSDLEALAESVIANGEGVGRHDALYLEIATGEFGAAACAGAIMVVLSNLLQRYRDDLHAKNPKWEEIAPMFGGCSFGQVVVAAAINFRHRDEWARTCKPTKEQERSISVIERALNYTPLEGVEPWRRNACADLVQVICGNDFAILEDSFFQFAKGMLS